MRKVDDQDLKKIGNITFLGLAALLLIVFWLKGHTVQNHGQFTFYFKNVNGLSEGNALRWNGLKIGVVDAIHPVRKSFKQDPLPAKALIELGKRHLMAAKKLVMSNDIGDLVIAQETINKAQLEIALGKASNQQTEVTEGEYVSIRAVVTVPDVPIGPLNQVTIVPSGLIGEQYVDITTIDIDADYSQQYDCTIPRFVVLEPLRLDELIRVNAESAEAITNLTNRVNAVFGQEDVDNIKRLIDSVAHIASDEEFQNNLKESAKNINKISKDFSLWKLLGIGNDK